MNRKIKFILVASVLSLMICSCAGKNNTEEKNSVQVINPVKQVTAEELQEEMQISLAGVPQMASDMTYTIIESGDMKIAQVQFVLDSAKVFLRSQRTEPEEIQDISGLYYEWTEVTQAQVGEYEATVYIKDSVGYIAWLNSKSGIVYNLGMTESANQEVLIRLANEICG